MAAWYQAIHASKRFRLGTKKKDISGNEYVYLKGVGSNLAGAWATYDATFAAALLAANAVGPVGISMAANTSTSNYSWYQISGANTISLSDTVASTPGPLYIDTTAGQVDDAGVAGDWIAGAINTAASASGVCPVFIDHPFVYNNGYLT